MHGYRAEDAYSAVAAAALPMPIRTSGLRGCILVRRQDENDQSRKDGCSLLIKGV